MLNPCWIACAASRVQKAAGPVKCLNALLRPAKACGNPEAHLLNLLSQREIAASLPVLNRIPPSSQTRGKKLISQLGVSPNGHVFLSLRRII